MTAKLPLKVGEVRSPAGVKWDVVVRDADNHPVCSVAIAGWPEKKANEHAAYIVKACNAYPELVKRVEILESVLRQARQFISNGIELNYIRMPAGPDSAHDTLPLIDATLSPKPPAPTCDDFVGGSTNSEAT